MTRPNLPASRVAAIALLTMLLPAEPVAQAGEPGAAAGSVPVVYGTDLFHPYDDPDDHYDLATLFAIREFEIKAVLLDLGDRQRARPGRVPLEQMFHLTGQRVSFAAGLSRALSTPRDTGSSQALGDQQAVELLMTTLRGAREPVTLITAGSVRDVCAAFNREPDLLRAKIRRLYINIGAADETVEWNVKLDVSAFLGVMRSGLPVYWCPCMPMTPHRNTTFWRFRQAEVLETLPAPLLNYFVYALQQVSPEELDPLNALGADLRPWRRLPGTMDRNMWCTASLLHAAGLHAIEGPGGFMPTTRPGDAASEGEVFAFEPAMVDIDDTGRTRSIRRDPRGTIHVFTTPDNARYQKAMTGCLRELLRRMPVQNSAAAVTE